MIERCVVCDVCGITGYRTAERGIAWAREWLVEHMEWLNSGGFDFCPKCRKRKDRWTVATTKACERFYNQREPVEVIGPPPQ